MRIRTIKPEFFNHEGIYDAESQTNLPLRLAFIGLWCVADKQGRFKWEPRRLGVQILPYDQVDFSRVLDALHTRGFILRYVSDDAHFGVIPSFNRHQAINNRERESELPEPLAYIDSDACLTRASRVDDAGKAEGKGKEGNKERNGKEVSCPITSDESEILKLIWNNAPKEGRERSSKKDLLKSWTKTPLADKPEKEELQKALNAWNASKKWKTGYAEGIHIWVEKQQWLNLPDPMQENKTTVKHVSYNDGLDDEADIMSVLSRPKP